MAEAVKAIRTMFAERDGVFSWRKALTALIGILFAVCVVAFLFGAPELPGSYQAIIAGVFAFYFAKDRLRLVAGLPPQPTAPPAQ